MLAMAHATAQEALPAPLRNPLVPRRFGRAAALLAAACIAAHIPLIASHFTLAPVTTAMMAVVSLMCIPCIHRLWQAPRTQDCIVAALLAAAMVAMHVTLTFTMSAGTTALDGDTTAHGHQHHTRVAVVHPEISSHQDHPMGMAPAIGAIYYLATLLAALQILLNVVAVALTVRRAKALAAASTTLTIGHRPVVSS
jgi:hypothetical protein